MTTSATDLDRQDVVALLRDASWVMLTTGALNKSDRFRWTVARGWRRILLSELEHLDRAPRKPGEHLLRPL